MQTKYESVYKQNIELEKLNREINAQSYIDLKQQFIEKARILDQQILDLQLKINNKNLQIKELTMDNLKMKSTNKSIQDRCELLEERHQTVQEVMN